MAINSHICPDCGIEFSSKLRFESHLRANSEEAFLAMFEKVAVNEIEKGRFPTGEAMIAAQIEPCKQQFIELRRTKGGFKKDKTEEPQKGSHLNVKKDKKK